MPIYEFRCLDCKKTSEYFQKVSDPTPSECAACGKTNTLEKVVSHTSFQLKGGGWYSDLYSSTKSSTTSEATSTKTSTSTPEPAPATVAAPKSEPPSNT